MGPPGPDATLTTINECTSTDTPATCQSTAHSTCTDTELSYQCGCEAGYSLDENDVCVGK